MGYPVKVCEKYVGFCIRPPQAAAGKITKEEFMEQHKIDRINALAQKKRDSGLTEEESAERAALHREYVEAFRANLSDILENTTVRRPDGSEEKLRNRKKDAEEQAKK